MRKLVFAMFGAGALLTAATVLPAGALPLDPGAMRAGIEAVNPIDTTWYRRYYGYRPYYRYRYGYRPYYRPYYGGYGYY